MVLVTSNNSYINMNDMAEEIGCFPAPKKAGDIMRYTTIKTSYTALNSTS